MVELIAWLRVTTGLLIVEISDEIFLASNFWMFASNGKDSKAVSVPFGHSSCVHLFCCWIVRDE